MIGERCDGGDARRGARGHETGVHGWDHVGWHDGLDRMSREEIARRVGARARGVPADPRASRRARAPPPGWTVNARSLEVEEERRLALHVGHARRRAVLSRRAEGRTFPTLEIPSTLPTLDETLAWPERCATTRRSARSSAAPCARHRSPHDPRRGRGPLEGARSSRRSSTTGARTACDFVRRSRRSLAEALARAASRVPARELVADESAGARGDRRDGLARDA